jgi:hypothetical protein
MCSQLKDVISKCEACSRFSKRQSKEPMVCREPPKRPWQHLAVDLFVFKETDFVVLADYYSDFFEVDALRTTTAKEVIKKMKVHFARHGIPESVRSDGGPQFVSQQFAEFADQW